jgi:hypothetical protein
LVSRGLDNQRVGFQLPRVIWICNQKGLKEIGMKRILSIGDVVRALKGI